MPSLIKRLARASLSKVVLTLSLIGCGVGTCLIASCNVVAPIAYLIEGEPNILALYTPEPDRTTVLFIDDLSSKMPRRSLRDLAGKTAEGILLEQGVIEEGKLISSAAARQVLNDTSENTLMPIADVGRAVGAQVVVHVSIKEFSVRQNASMIAPTAVAEVKVIDAYNNERLWPNGERGYVLRVERPEQPVASIMTSDSRRKLQDILAVEVGTRLALMFYEHERERLRDQKERRGEIL